MSTFPHPLMRMTDTIDILGINGDQCRVAGPGFGNHWGPELARHSTGLFDAPFKANYGKSMLGQRFESWSPQRRDIVATFHILNPITGTELDTDPDLWHTIHSRFRALFGSTPESEATIRYGSVDGDRDLGIRLLQESKSFSSNNFEGLDPHILSYGSVMLTLACENPYYIGGVEKYTWETALTGGAIPVNGLWFTLPHYNPSTVMIWKEWTLTDRAQWILPDYSYGWQEYGRGLADQGKTVSTPLLTLGEGLDVQTSPDSETFIAANNNPVGNRMGGRDLEYPILAGCGSPDPDGPNAGCVVRVKSVTNPDGARCELAMPRWYAEPFSTPLVV
jgi:hypothetical protein